MTRLICRLFGHRWEHVGGNCLACVRCHENGWRL